MAPSTETSALVETNSSSSGFGFISGDAPVAVVNTTPDISSAFDSLNNNSNGVELETQGVARGSVGSVGGVGGIGGVGEDAAQVSNQLQQHEASLEILEQQCASIQTIVYQFEEMRTQFLNAKSELAQLNGNLERLQSNGIDTVVVQHLNQASQDAIKSERKVLVKRISFLFDQISVTNEYMSKLTVN